MERWNHLSKEEREPYVVAAATMNTEMESSSDDEDTDDEELEGETLSAGELGSKTPVVRFPARQRLQPNGGRAGEINPLTEGLSFSLPLSISSCALVKV